MFVSLLHHTRFERHSRMAARVAWWVMLLGGVALWKVALETRFDRNVRLSHEELYEPPDVASDSSRNIATAATTPDH